MTSPSSSIYACMVARGSSLGTPMRSVGSRPPADTPVHLLGRNDAVALQKGGSQACEVPVLEFHNLNAAPGRAVERHRLRRDADAVEQNGPNMWVGRRGHRLRSKDHGPPDATATAGSHMAQGRVPRSSQRRSRTRSWATASSQLERRGLLGNPCGGDDLGLHALEDLAWRAGYRRCQLSGGASQFLGRHNTTDEPALESLLSADAASREYQLACDAPAYQIAQRPVHDI